MGNTYIFDDSHDYTGAVATFTDTHGTSRITNISVPFSPIQDLHGYANPWPAGGGKQLLNPAWYSTTAITSNDVTATPNGDGTFTLSGTASGLAYLNLFPSIDPYKDLSDFGFFEAGQSYKLSGGKSADIAMFFGIYGSGTDYVDAGSGATINFTQEIIESKRYRLCIRVLSGVNTNGVVVKPMIEKGTSVSPWQPYSNICPISGRTGVSVYRTGINIWDEEWERGTIGLRTGAKVDDNTKIRSKNYVPISPNTAYYYKFPGNWRMVYFDSDKNVVEQGNTYSPNIILTSPATAHYLLFALDATTEYGNNIAINYPATDHDYHAYNGSTYSVDWTTQAGTVYGGTLDVVTGVLTVDWASVDLGNISDMIAQSGYFQFGKALLQPPMREIIDAKAICSAYPMLSTQADKTMWQTPGYVRIKDSSFATVADFKTAVAGQTFCYELATPLTYQLTPQTIGVIKNSVNNLWASNNESITVTVSDILYGFQGWLIKVGNPLAEIPTTMIEAESYKVTPDQRMEESAERDTTGYLWRDTVRNTPTKIEFNTPPTNNTDVSNLNSILRTAFTVTAQRRLPVAFYDPEEDCYKTCDAYMPDVEYPMHLIDPSAKTILYDSIRYAFIGY